MGCICAACQGQNGHYDRTPPVHRRQRRLHLCGAGWANCGVRHKGRVVCAERPVCPDVAGLSGLGAVEGRKGGVKDDRKNLVVTKKRLTFANAFPLKREHERKDSSLKDFR